MKRIFLLLFCLLGQFACAGPVTQPVRGITYQHEIRENPPLHLHVATVDLAEPGLVAVVRPGGEKPDDAAWQTPLATVGAIARREMLELAVNGDFFAVRDTREMAGRKVPYFDGNPARVTGWAMSDGKLWSQPKNNRGAALIVTAENRIVITDDVGPHLIKSARQIIGGSVLLVADGKPILQPQARAGGRNFVAPRTAAGTDRDGRKLILVVVDGRRKDYSAGMSLEDLGKEMARLGCHTAINLDGGGSTTMVLRQGEEWRVLNRPSDGSDFVVPLSRERPVANVLGVKRN